MSKHSFAEFVPTARRRQNKDLQAIRADDGTAVVQPFRPMRHKGAGLPPVTRCEFGCCVRF